MGVNRIANGTAGLRVAKVRERSTVVTSWARSPFSLLTPRTPGNSVWAYTSSYGGGMVAGDQTRLDVKLDEGTRCFLSTQASTKIYRNPDGRPCSHCLNVTLDADSLLVLAPDPVQCFAESSYDQDQSFQLAPDANLLLVDSISSGRSARGERWAFQHYASKNRIERDGRLILLDSIRLAGSDMSVLSNRFRTGRFNCISTAILVGPKLNPYSMEILAAIQASPIERSSELISSAFPWQDGVILRIAGTTGEAVARSLQKLLRFVPALLQGDPWKRKW